MHEQQRKILKDSRRHTLARSDRHGTLRSYERWQEIKKARADNSLLISAKAIHEEAVKISDLHGMSIEQAEKDIRSVIGDIPEIAIDECKEMTKEDFEKIKDHPLLGKVEGMIQTDNSNDWFFCEFTRQFIDKP